MRPGCVACLLFWVFFPSCTASAQERPISGESVQSCRVLSPDGPILIITCSLRLGGKQRVSPLVTVAVPDGNGRVMKRKKSYGGRYYQPEIFIKLSKLTALAVTASPVPAKVKPGSVRIYQFVFFDVPVTANRVDVSLAGGEAWAASPEKGAVQQEGGAAPEKREKPGGRFFPAKADVPPVSERERASADIGLVGGSVRLGFAERPEIVSFLDEEVQRLSRTENKIETAVRPDGDGRTGPPHSPEQARKGFESLGVVPAWEYVRIGMTLDEVSQAFPAEVVRGGGHAELSVMDCASGICEYALQGLKGTAEYRLYFRERRLQSLVLILSLKDKRERLTFLERLKELYGGRIWRRDGGAAMGESISSIEFVSQFGAIRIETMGSTLRVFGAD